MPELKLNKVTIENFLSIKYMTLDIENDLKILVGKNESGKTNILKALSMLEKGRIPDAKLIRMNSESDNPSQVIFDLFVGWKELYDEIKTEVVSAKALKLLKSILEKENNIFVKYIVDMREEKPRMEINFDLDVPDADYYIVPYGQGEVVLNVATTGEEIYVNTQSHSVIVDVPDTYSDTQYIVEANVEKIKDIFNLIIRRSLKIPEVIFWKYSEEYLLPETIDTETFVNDPNKSIPLRNIFRMAGIDDIKREYEDRKKQGENAWFNFLKYITKRANACIGNIWKTGAKIKVEAYGDTQIKVSVEDSENQFTFFQRSDGYKRMITFITMISSQNIADRLSNKLIIIDEPDATVDIPGTRYLLDELIKISKNNYVFISTHSPSMIDVKNIRRHYIVEKKREITLCEVASESNYNTADTLYEGLGMEYYADIKNKNVAFEGWSDKVVFDTYLERHSNKKYSEITPAFTGGVDNFASFAALWLFLVKKPTLVLVSDNDQKAIANRKKFLGKNIGIKWFTYSELCEDKSVCTIEDFIKIDRIKEVVRMYIKNIDGGNDIIKNNDFGECKTWSGIEKTIRKILNLANSGDSNYNINEIIFSIKQKIYENLKPDDIMTKYGKVVEKISDELK